MSENPYRISLEKKSVQPVVRTVLIRIILLSVLLVAVVTVLSYRRVYRQVSERTLSEVQLYVERRIRTDSQIFQEAEQNMQKFAAEYLRLYTSDLEVTEEDFWTYFFVGDEGATRMKREYFDGVYTADGVYRYGISAFIGNNQPVDDPDFRRRMILSYRLLSQFGPAWTGSFANVYTSFPENGIITYWPEEPWGLTAEADLPMNELSVIKATLQQDNPQRNPVWTGLYYDETAEEWVISYELPLDYQGKHLANPSHDVYLTEIVNHIISESAPGTYNFLIKEDGYLIAYPGSPSETQKWIGQLSLEKIEDPAIVRAYELIAENGGTEKDSVKVIENEADDTYLIAGALGGPGWWFVTVVPRQIIRDSANQTALIVLLEGGIILLATLLVINIIIYTQVQRPLLQLRQAAEEVGRGHYSAVAENEINLPLHLNNEIGLLATRFVEMAHQIRYHRNTLETIVEDRTKELENSNAQLRELSLLDGLTYIHNRRSFDRDVERVFSQALDGHGTFSLLMADIDLFKKFNDGYGHAEGDRVLVEVAKAIRDNIRSEDRVYRYGGEEFVVIFNNADIETARVTAQRVLDTVSRLKFIPRQDVEAGVTLSAGLQEFSSQFDSAGDMVRMADEKLYVSKKKGRNRMTV